jgi:hypothetical protein
MRFRTRSCRLQVESCRFSPRLCVKRRPRHPEFNAKAQRRKAFPTWTPSGSGHRSVTWVFLSWNQAVANGERARLGRSRRRPRRPLLRGERLDHFGRALREVNPSGENHNPNGVAALVNGAGPQPRWGCVHGRSAPKVASRKAGQPWAEGHNPFGIEQPGHFSKTEMRRFVAHGAFQIDFRPERG